MRDAVALLDRRGVGFEYDGEMSADVALDERLMRQLYPFCRLGGPANILVMPELHSANIAAKLLPQLGGGTVVGPLLLGLVASGADRQYGRDRVRSRQPRRALGARRDPLIATPTHGRRERSGRETSDRRAAAEPLSHRRAGAGGLGSEPDRPRRACRVGLACRSTRR